MSVLLVLLLPLPLYLVVIEVGQTVPLLALLAVAGDAEGRRDRVGLGVLLGAVCALKLWPLVLLPLYALRHAQRVVVAALVTLGVLSVAGYALLGEDMVDATAASLRHASTVLAWNGNGAPISVLFRSGFPAWAAWLCHGVLLLGLGGAWWRIGRRSNEPIETAWSTVILGLPMMWPAYVLVPLFVALRTWLPRRAQVAAALAAPAAMVPWTPGWAVWLYGLVLLAATFAALLEAERG